MKWGGSTGRLTAYAFCGATPASLIDRNVHDEPIKITGQETVPPRVASRCNEGLEAAPAQWVYEKAIRSDISGGVDPESRMRDWISLKASRVASSTRTPQ